VQGVDANGDPVKITDASDLLARIFQHETDHLDGVLFIDHLTPQQRREALTTIRNQALGLPTEHEPASAKETL
jgi:peptide deformylase